MSCNVDRTLQNLIQRELQKRVDGLNAIVHSHMGGWASAHGMPGPRAIGAAALSAGLTDALSTVAGMFFDLVRPIPTPAQVEDARSRYLGQLKVDAWFAGVPEAKVAELIEGQLCEWHVLDGLASGELVLGAMAKVE